MNIPHPFSRIFIYGLGAMLLGFIAAPVGVFASSFIFQSKTVTIQTGKTFTLPVVVDPASEQQYTVRLTATYPADKLEVTSFVFAASWLTVPQPGYDLIDNKRGELIKTAGFPTGFLSPAPFGVITFRAKQAGEAVITVGQSSFILNAESKSSLQSRPRVLVAIIEQPAAGLAPAKLPMVEPLPSLPPGEQNLFDVSAAVLPKVSFNLTPYLIVILLVSMVLGAALAMLIERLRRRRIFACHKINKIKPQHDKKVLKK